MSKLPKKITKKTTTKIEKTKSKIGAGSEISAHTVENFANPALPVRRKSKSRLNEFVSAAQNDRSKSGKWDCKTITSFVNDILTQNAANKQNELGPCGGEEAAGCGCTSHAGSSVKADVVVLIDTSSSMSPYWSKISTAATAGIAKAVASCGADARVTFLGVGKPLSGTVFTKSHRDYIHILPGTRPPLAGDVGDNNYDDEEGANAIEDISKYFDWRENACRAAFYISDERLDAIDSTLAESQAAANAALSAALANNVTIFAHYIKDGGSDDAANILQYKGMCEGSGGSLLTTGNSSAELAALDYTTILERVICGACGTPKCTEVKFPKIEPCIEVKWGDSDCDCIESDDVEIVSISVCNCYSNVTFNSFSIAAVWVSNNDGTAVPELPDGTPSVQVVPLGPICFGDIPPCVDGKPGCVAREFVLRLRGARSGPYKLNLYGVCYDIRHHVDTSACFSFEVCKD